jgi:hypothetical protein
MDGRSDRDMAWRPTANGGGTMIHVMKAQTPHAGVWRLRRAVNCRRIRRYVRSYIIEIWCHTRADCGAEMRCRVWSRQIESAKWTMARVLTVDLYLNRHTRRYHGARQKDEQLLIGKMINDSRRNRSNSGTDVCVHIISFRSPAFLPLIEPMFNPLYRHRR